MFSEKHFCKAFIATFFFVVIALSSQSQSCPVNIDFEVGDFTNWQYRKGLVRVEGGNQNKIDWLSQINTPPLLLDGLEMIGPNDVSLDSVGRFPRHSPNGSNYSIRLGNNKGGNGADGIFYTLTIPATAARFSIIYNYAVVLEKPTHSLAEQPRFKARIADVVSGQEVSCVSFDFVASSTLPGFIAEGDKLYKGWTPISVDLSKYRGRTVRLELITTDCTQNQHFGYAYVDVNSECDGKIKGSVFCQGDTTTTLVAPFGYQSYAWYSDTSYSQLISATQQYAITLSAAPPGTLFPVIVTPYPAYGCVDTLYALVSSAIKPVSQAGPDQTVCSRQPVQIGIQPRAGLSYNWTPAGLVQQANLSNPLTVAPFTAPAQLVVKTTETATGCFSQDTINLVPRFVDTATFSSGKLLYCPGETIQATFKVSNPNTQVQWLFNRKPISGSNGFLIIADKAGSYQAQIQQGGCTDTSRLYFLQYFEQPKADFELGRPSYCTVTSVAPYNRSSIVGNESLNYQWRFSDGTSQQGANASKLFTQPGEQWIMLAVTSVSGCTDSIRKTISIVSVCEPMVPTAFTPNGDTYNERLKPYLFGAQALQRFAIYNRYGAPVFTTSTENAGWDGKTNGQLAPAGVYVWQLDYTDAYNKPAGMKGTVVLIR